MYKLRCSIDDDVDMMNTNFIFRELFFHAHNIIFSSRAQWVIVYRISITTSTSSE